MTDYKYSSINICGGFLIYTGQWPDRIANKELWGKLVRRQCWTKKYEKGND